MYNLKNLLKNLLIIFCLLALVGFFAYSIIEYQRIGIAEEGIVTCENGKCFWSAHIHVYSPIQICGEKYVFSKFKGPLNNSHTHGDENVIHWHNKISFDPEKKQFLESSPFALNLIFKNHELPITDESLIGKKDGDICRGFAGTWKVFVNGALRSDWRNYEWQDRDIIIFVFDERTTEEVEQELHRKTIEFPSLGEG